MIIKIPCKKNIKGEVFLPGSKSYTNRALVLASLAEGTSVLKNYSRSDDSSFLIDSLIKMGVSIKKERKSLVIEGTKGCFTPFKGELYVGAAGTTMRFLIPLCCLAGGEIVLSGTKRLCERPVAHLVTAMRKLGATIDYQNKQGFLPLVIKGFEENIKNIVSIEGDISSQFISSLLLIASALPQGLNLSIIGNPISQSYIDMTMDYLNKFGIDIVNNNYRNYHIAPQIPQAQKMTIEGDASGASYFWGLAALTKGSIQTHNISIKSIQGDVQFVKILEKMGCKMDYGNNWIRVTNTSSYLKAISVDMELLPDTAQTLAVIAATANGKTQISGLMTLKHKETDRCKSMCTELKKLGIKCNYDETSLTIYGGKPSGNVTIETYEDHRMAMSFAILACIVPNISIAHPNVVKKSFPSFWQKLLRLINNRK